MRYLSDELKVSEEEKQRWYAHWIQQGLSALEQLLRQAKSGDYCVGNTPTLADCCLVPQWANAQRMGCDLSHYPRCQAVYDAVPGYRRLSPPRRKINKTKFRPREEGRWRK